MKEILEKAKKIKCLVCDMDGVLTDGSIYLDNEGNEFKTFHVQDGLGIKLLLAAGIDVAIITTSQNKMITHRMRQLGILHYFTGQVDKQNAFSTLKDRLNIVDEEFAYIGDDLPDLPLIIRVGLGVAVANATNPVKKNADWQTELPGGRGAVREICDLILAAQDKEEMALARYLSS